METNIIHVEVAYALPHEQKLIALEVPEHTTVKQAIEYSKILAYFIDIDLNQNKVGIFSKVCTLDTPLRDGDRVEIYRPLIADPKEVRKRRALEGKSLTDVTHF